MLGAEILAAVGGSLRDFAFPDALAAFAGVAPAPRASGTVSGNLHRPAVYHCRLKRVFYASALVSIRCDPNPRAFYDRKRAEEKKHVQAVMAWPADASTSCGHRSVTAGATTSHPQ